MSHLPFQISALPYAQFAPLFSLKDEDLTIRQMVRQTVVESPGTPCRVSLADAAVGETVLLLPYVHQPAASPYRSGGAIFVRENVTQAQPAPNEVPEVIRRRLMSVRDYDAAGMMVNADVVDGVNLEGCITRFFATDNVRYLHLHNARPGCYSCRVDRA